MLILRPAEAAGGRGKPLDAQKSLQTQPEPGSIWV